MRSVWRGYNPQTVNRPRKRGNFMIKQVGIQAILVVLILHAAACGGPSEQSFDFERHETLGWLVGVQGNLPDAGERLRFSIPEDVEELEIGVSLTRREDAGGIVVEVIEPVNVMPLIAEPGGISVLRIARAGSELLVLGLSATGNGDDVPYRLYVRGFDGKTKTAPKAMSWPALEDMPTNTIYGEILTRIELIRSLEGHDAANAFSGALTSCIAARELRGKKMTGRERRQERARIQRACYANLLSELRARNLREGGNDP